MSNPLNELITSVLQAQAKCEQWQFDDTTAEESRLFSEAIESLDEAISALTKISARRARAKTRPNP